MRQTHRPHSVREVAGAGRPVEQHGGLAGEVNGEDHGVRSDGGRHEDADVRCRDLLEPPPDRLHADEETLVGQDSGEVVRHHDLAPADGSAPYERLEDGLSQHLRRRVPRRRLEPRRRRRFRRCALHEALREDPEVADGLGHVIAPEAETLLDGERDLHAVEAVEPKCVESGPGLAHGGGFIADLLLEDLGDRRLRRGFNLAGGALGERRARGGEVEGPRSKEHVIRHVGGRLDARRVVPGLEPRVELFAGQIRERVAAHLLDRDLNSPPRRQEDKVRQQDPDALEQTGLQVRCRAGAREAEHAAADAACADQDQCDIRNA